MLICVAIFSIAPLFKGTIYSAVEAGVWDRFLSVM